MASAEALERFERQTAWPMLVLALAFIPLLVIPWLTELSPAVETTFFALDWFIWAAFAVEYGIRLYLAPQKGRFVRANVIDLIVVVVPFLRPLRIARSARALRLLRAARLAVLLARAARAGRRVLTGHGLHYALLVALAVTVASAGLVLEFERDAPDANIASFPDALWWAITTVTTVGYGDWFHTTAAGRGVAAVLMLIGIGLFGLLAASLASFFIEQDRERDDRLDEVLERLERIERRQLTSSDSAN
jgi:voltage-gated potassium channel